MQLQRKYGSITEWINTAVSLGRKSKIDWEPLVEHNDTKRDKYKTWDLVKKLMIESFSSSGFKNILGLLWVIQINLIGLHTTMVMMKAKKNEEEHMKNEGEHM